MTAEEIRNIDPIASQSWESPEGQGEQFYEIALMLREIAAQLAETDSQRLSKREQVALELCKQWIADTPKGKWADDMKISFEMADAFLAASKKGEV